MFQVASSSMGLENGVWCREVVRSRSDRVVNGMIIKSRTIRQGQRVCCCLCRLPKQTRSADVIRQVTLNQFEAGHLP